MALSDNKVKIQSLIDGINALPEAGSGEPAEPVLQEKSVTPSKSAQAVTPDTGYDGLSKVNVGAIPGEYIIPSGTVSVTTNGEHNVREAEKVNVNVTAPTPVLQTKTVTPTTSQQSITPDSGYDGLSKVDVAAIPNEYIVPTGTVAITENGVHNVREAENVNVNVPAPEISLQGKTVNPSTSAQTVKPDSDYDGLSQVTVNAMPTATQATPSISVSSGGLITASATQTAGYVSAGTKSVTQQLTAQAAKTVTPSASEQTAVASGVYTTGAVKVAGDANLVADNIKSGVSIFGVPGSYEGSGGSGGGSFPNGTEWTQGNVGTNISFGAIHYANGLWVAPAYSDHGIYYSSDGKTWLSSNITSGAFSDLGYANGCWVACSSNNASNTGIYFSHDGITWELSNKTTGNYYALHYANGLWVAGSTYVSSSNTCYSTDGITWTNCTGVSNSFWDILYYDGIWVAAADGYMYYSSSGTSWTKSSKTGTYKKLCRNDDIWVACGDGVIYSTDGKIWTSSNATNTSFQDVAYGNGIFVAGSTSMGEVYYSYDGMTWIKSDLAENRYNYAVAYANGIWVLSSNSSIYYSYDAITWTQAILSANKVEVRYFLNVNGIWLATSRYGKTSKTIGGILYSVTWEPPA